MFRFNYKDMKTWFDNNLTDASIFKTDANVHAWVMTRDDSLKKFNKSTKSLDGFLLRSINKVRLFKPVAEKHHAIYPQGLYVLIDDNRPDWIIFVFPRSKADIAGKPYKHLYADHYSIPYDKNDKKKPIHFHETLYQPVVDPVSNKDGEVGAAQYTRDYFADNVSLHTSSYSDTIIKNPAFSPYVRTAILDILKFYHLKRAGGKRTSAPISRQTKKQKVPATPSLENVWNKNKIDHVFMFSIKHAGKHCITATIYDKKDREEGETMNSFFFVSDGFDIKVVKERVVDWIVKNLS